MSRLLHQLGIKCEEITLAKCCYGGWGGNFQLILLTFSREDLDLSNCAADQYANT